MCNLGSINLGAFVKTGQIDWDHLREAVHHCTHFLDNVIDANKYPLQQITDLAQRIRRIGLGVMGWADALIKLDIPYMSDEAVELGRKMMAFVDEEAKRASEKLAEQRGAFPEWERSIWGPDATCARRPDGARVRPERYLRNCNVTTVAPTGTISMIADCSSGIEPIFAVAFMRYQADTRMPDANKFFVERAKAEGWYSDGLMERVAEEGHIHFPEVPEAVQRTFQTAHDITPEWHVRMQAAFQEFTDAAISKTTNFPHSATQDDVRQIYELAFELKCKGVTVYRDGSRENQVLSTGATTQAPTTAEPAVNVTATNGAAETNGAGHGLTAIATTNGHADNGPAPLPANTQTVTPVLAPSILRPKAVPRAGLPACRFEVDTPLGSLNLFVTEQDGQPFEVFAIIGRAGSDTMAFTEAIGRILSIALRSGVPVDELARQLRGIGGARSWGFGLNRVRSVPDAIGKVLQEHYVEGHSFGIPSEEAHQEELPLAVPAARGEICPACGNATLMQVEGCAKCAGCGHSEC